MAFFTALTGSRFLWNGKNYTGKVFSFSPFTLVIDKKKTIFTSLDFDVAKNGRKCTHACGIKAAHLGYDWCYTDEGDGEWEYCTRGNY